MKKLILGFFFFTIILLIFIWNEQGNYEHKKDEYSNQIKKMQLQIQEAKIQEVREQERRTLQGIRQAFINFTNKYPLDLFERDRYGNIHYGNIKGDSVFYDPKTMFIRSDTEWFYNIHDKKTNNLIAGHVRPYWNMENIKYVLSVVATPFKQSGNTGDVFAFDSYTGEMLIDNSEDCAPNTLTIGKDKRPYILLNYKHPNNKNPNSCLWTINNKYLWRKDSSPEDKIIFYFNEPILTNENSNNFKDFGLGNYNREFQEKIILPFETSGIGNTDMQITVILGAQEHEIMYLYNPIVTDYKKMIKNIDFDIEKLLWQSRMIIFICMFCIMLLALYLAYIEHEVKEERKQRRVTDKNDRCSNTGNDERISLS